jgi:hypothetical protein
MNTEKVSEMRELVVAVGGPLEPGENAKSWFSAIAEKAQLSVRAVKGAFYGEYMSKATERKLRAAAGRREAEHLAKRFEGLAASLNVGDADFHSDTIAALVSAARVLRGLDRAGNNKELNEEAVEAQVSKHRVKHVSHGVSPPGD